MEIKLVVGLGNPGQRYEQNRHNVGFQVVDLLARRWQSIFTPWKGKSFVASCVRQGFKVILLKPQVFMNLSGESVSTLVRFYRLELNNLLLVYDDLDLPTGVIRLRPGGGAGGHKGVKSVIAALGSQQFPRLRVGIGRPPGRLEPAAYVLQNFSRAEEEIMGVTRELAADAVESWLREGLEQAMNNFNAQPASLPNEAT